MTCPFPQDLDRCVTVFKAQKDDTDQPWVYVGKQRAHYKTIHGEKDSSNTLRKLLFVKISTKTSVFPVSPKFYAVNPLIGPLGAYLFQAHEIREGGLKRGGEGGTSNYFPRKQGGLLKREYLFKRWP